MKMPLVRPVLMLSLFLILLSPSRAQDSLQQFIVKNRSGKVIVSWISALDSVVQISIQRSPDSLKGFKTITTMPDPTVRSNGYLDIKAPNTTQFYKLYVQLSRGRFFVTKPKKPILDTARIVAPTTVKKEPQKYTAADTAQWIKMEMAGVTRQDVKYLNGKKVLDSAQVTVQEIKNAFHPSVYIFTNREGNVVITLPESKSAVYSIRFFLENGTQIMQLNKVKESLLTLDKSNFLHAGWFHFELYENEVLKEKHKFFLPKDRQ